ncbi:hypothetical protein, partial [Marinospirillum sp.]|uniref:hypothetical protein n=1 Tax=Marinospirillum sp. TaxID=2183934 RepID=UPI0025BCBC82
IPRAFLKLIDITTSSDFAVMHSILVPYLFFSLNSTAKLTTITRNKPPHNQLTPSPAKSGKTLPPSRVASAVSLMHYLHHKTNQQGIQG